MDLKYKLMILVAGILALTSSLLTALGMADLFQGLFIVFLIIDLGRFLVLNFIVDEWYNLKTIKWVLTVILALLFVYSAVGVYNKLNSMIPSSIQTAMIEAASYNKAQDNALIKHSRSENLADLAQKEYLESIKWNNTDYENCIARANKDPELENKCNNTKRRLDNQASNKLKQASKEADKNLDNVQATVDKNTKNQGEIAGILTTVCKLMPGTDCKTYDGLQSALTIIILLTICGLDYLQLGIVLAVNTRKNKEKKIEKSTEEKQKTQDKPIIEEKKVIEPSKPIIKEKKLEKKVKIVKPVKIKEKIVEPEVVKTEEKQVKEEVKPTDTVNTSVDKPTRSKKKRPFSIDTHFYM